MNMQIYHYASSTEDIFNNQMFYKLKMMKRTSMQSNYARQRKHRKVVTTWYILNIALCMKYLRNISSIFSSNSETNASELLENIEEMTMGFIIKIPRL